MTAVPEHNQRVGEALQAARYARGRQSTPPREAASGPSRISSVVLPFLEQLKGRLPTSNLRLDFGVRKFDVRTGEAWSAYFRVVNTKSRRASHYYIVDLSARLPLLIMADSLDVGSDVRRRELWDEMLGSHDDVTERFLTKLLERATSEADER